jgi:flagellin
VGAQVTASINQDGKLVLSNSTGATISVKDKSATNGLYTGASGFVGAMTADTFTAYTGFLQLDSTNGSPIRITKGNLGATAPGQDADVGYLGFKVNTSEFANGLDSYTVTGSALTDAGKLAAWDQNAMQINGVNIYNSNIATTSFEGKIKAINNFSDQTGVVASGYLESVTSLTAANLSNLDSAGTLIRINGITAFTLAAAATATTIDALALAINGVSTATGITATVQGLNIKLSGTNVTSLRIDEATATGVTAKTSGSIFTLTTISTNAGIKLDSVKNNPISIALGDSATAGQIGLFEQNVGAADFQVNAPTILGGSGTTLGSLNVSTLESATSAISSIDNAIEKVSSMRSKLGAMENRLNNVVNNLTNISTNTSASRSRIEDTDYATETTALAKSQIISQAATAMLAQANQQPQTVLSLLK